MPVGGGFGDGPADAAACFGGVAFVSGDDVEVDVWDGLAGQRSVVDADGVVSAAVVRKACELVAGDGPQVCVFGVGEVEDVSDVSPRDDEGVAGC